MTPLIYYLWGHMKSLVYETKSQMVAELIGCIFDATVQMRNYGTMPHRAYEKVVATLSNYCKLVLQKKL
jgi:hypothetical protein